MYAIVEWIGEGLFNVINVSSITEPRKPLEEYKIGDIVTAKFQGKPYQAGVVELSADRMALQAQLTKTHKGDSLKVDAIKSGSRKSTLPAKSGKSDTAVNVPPKPSGSKKSAEAVECQPIQLKAVQDNSQISSSSALPKSDLSTVYVTEISGQKRKNSTTLPDFGAKKKMPLQNTADLESRAQKDLAEDLLKKRKLTVPETPTHKDCVSRKEFNELKDEVRRLRKKIQNITATEVQLINTNCSPLTSPLPRPSSPISRPPSTPTSRPQSTERPLTPSTAIEINSVEKFNNHSLDSLKDSISHIDKLYDAVKILIQKLFPDTYIISHSVSGKASNSKSLAKPPFDSRLYGVLVTILKSKFGVTNKEITEKVHSVQKCIQRKS